MDPVAAVRKIPAGLYRVYVQPEKPYAKGVFDPGHGKRSDFGDAIRIDGHYFVVLQRKGDKLYTAEGSYSSKVRASLATYGYYIKDNQLYQNRYNSKGVSTGSVKVTFVSGYRFK